MTRTEFLNELEQYLTPSLDQSQIYLVLHSFAEIYNNGERQGKREFEISNEIGKPHELAGQIISMWACSTLKKAPTLRNLFFAYGSMGHISVFSLLAAFPALFVSLLLSLCMLLVVLLLSVCSVAGMFSSFFAFSYVDTVIALCALFASCFSWGYRCCCFPVCAYGASVVPLGRGAV